MAIYKGSRYQNSVVDYFSTSKSGDALPTVFYSVSDMGRLSYWTHVYTFGERLDSIAYQYYKRPELWWMIPEFNPEISDFTKIPPGTPLRIPSV